MIQIRLDSIHCVENTETFGEDETFVLVSTVDLDHTVSVQGFPVPIPASQVALFGPHNLNDGDTADLRESKPFWGLNTGMPASLPDPERVISHVQLMEHDSGSPSATRMAAEGAVTSAVFGALGASRQVISQRIAQSVSGAVAIPTGAPDFEDPIGDPVELTFTAEEVQRAESGQSVEKEVTITGDGGEFRLRFTAWGVVWAPPPVPAHAAAAPQFEYAGVPKNLDVAAFDRDGALNMMWITGTGSWHGPLRVSPPGVAPAGGPVAMAKQHDRQLDAVFVDVNGSVNVMWVVDAGVWQGPVGLTPPDVAQRGVPTPVALGRQLTRQLDAVFVDKDGAVNVMWVVGTGKWEGPVGISPPDVAGRGIPTSVALARQLDNQLDAVFVDRDGAVNVMWVVDAGVWQGPVRLTPPDTAPPGAPVALAKQNDHQLDAVFVDRDGAVSVMWVVDTGVWQGPHPISPPGVAWPGATVALAKQLGNQLDAVFVDVNGSVNVMWIVDPGEWQGPVGLSPPNTAPADAETGTAPVTLARQTGNQLDAFFVNGNGTVMVMWVIDTGAWQGPHPITP
ncbi:hypothetical protein ACTWP5_23895 [Streptomyces sp. 4N509B]|uniref:hypothetical protein n=1 Tax=Streptomyces sp. 4N509B TaxID=3457413 RepID=UPI003FD3B224